MFCPYGIGRTECACCNNYCSCALCGLALSAPSSHCPIEYCELEPGDALIFHCNAIHRSDANRSPRRRWTLLICYNRVDNDTFIKADDRYFVPLDKVEDGALRRAGLRFASGDNQEHFASRPYVPDLRKAS